MIKKQVIGVLIGLALFVGCKPKVEVHTSKDTANFIVHWKPKSAKFTLYKLDKTKEPAEQKIPVEYKLDGSTVQENLLNNPLFLKLEVGQTYSFAIEKQGYTSMGEEITLKIGEVLNKRYELSNGEEKAKNPEGWSDFRGSKSWEEADKECFNLDMRLPTIEELKLAYKEGITKSWQKDGYHYWSSTPYDAERYYLLNVYLGYTYSDSRNTNYLVRCRR